MIAVSLLVGSDHDLSGIQGIGIDTALRFVKCFNEEEILDRFVFKYMCICILCLLHSCIYLLAIGSLNQNEV